MRVFVLEASASIQQAGKSRKPGFIQSFRGTGMCRHFQ